MMQKITNLGRQLLLRAQLGAHPFVQKTVVSPLLAKKEVFRSILKPFFNGFQLQGQNQAGELTVTYIGTETSIRVFRKHLFPGHSTISKMGRVSVRESHKMTTIPDTDIVIIEAGSHVINKLPRQNAIVIPPYVHFLLDVRGEWDDIKGQFGSNARNDLRLTRKFGYTSRVSNDWQDFEYFFDKMYLPTMEDRHGESNSSMSKSDASIYFQHGLLLLVERDGQDVAAVLWYPRQKVLEHILVGILASDVQLMKEGAGVATTILAMQWANQQGFEALNLLGTSPFIKSGMFQYKRKWGTRVIVPDNEDKRIWLKVQRDTPAVRRFFKDNPIIVINKRSALQGLIIVDNPANINDKDKKEWQKKYATPGLKNLLVCSMTDLVNEPSYQVLSKPIVVGIEN